MPITVNVAGQVGQIRLSPTKALWPLFETVINSIQSLEDSDVTEKKIVLLLMLYVQSTFNLKQMGRVIQQRSLPILRLLL